MSSSSPAPAASPSGATTAPVSPPPSATLLPPPPPPPASSPSPSPPPPPPPSGAPPPSSSPPPSGTLPAAPVSSSPPPPPASAVTPPPPPPSPPAANSPPATTTPPAPKSTTPSHPPPPPPPSSSSSSSSSSISTTSLIGVGIGGVLAISIVALLLYCLCRKTRRKKKIHYPRQEAYGGLPLGGLPAHAVYKDSYNIPSVGSERTSSVSHATDRIPSEPRPPPPPVIAPLPKKEHNTIPNAANSKYCFTYEELEAATDGFSISNKLGEGGFGCVYKGTVSGGQLVAVKQLKVGASQGEKEFQAEVEIISRVHHRHLVSLVGYCISERQRLLVYDYVPNGTLEYHLHRRRDGSVLDWPMRLKIACGAARGLAYLHEDCHPRIIHRDIKSSNILLDDKFESQVSDFGLAKLTSDTDTHVTTRVMGTFGYLAPEYASSGKLTEKSDVFSFGVVLLELLTGRKPVDASQPLGHESLVEWARPVLNQINCEDYLDIIADPALNGVYDPKEMLRMAEAAAACIRHSASKRPRMGQVVRALEDEISLSDLSRGLRSGQGSRDYDYENGNNYNIEMGRLKKLALESQAFGSDYSGSTSAEYKGNQKPDMMSSTEYQQTMASQEMRPTSAATATMFSPPIRQVRGTLDNDTSLSGFNRHTTADHDQNVANLSDGKMRKYRRENSEMGSEYETSPKMKLNQRSKDSEEAPPPSSSLSLSDDHNSGKQYFQPQQQQTHPHRQPMSVRKKVAHPSGSNFAAE